MTIDNYYVILYSSATPKQVKKTTPSEDFWGEFYATTGLPRKGPCINNHRCNNNGESQEVHDIHPFFPLPVGIRTMQSLFSKMAFIASCLPLNLKYPKTIIIIIIIIIIIFSA